MKKMFVLVCSFMAVLGMQIIVFAATTWSDGGAYEISSGDGWHNHCTTGEMLENRKTTESGKVEVYTVSKTMSSVPSFRLITSEGNARSNAFSTPSVGRSKINNSNTGTVGYPYYASIKPAWNQNSDDQTIKIQFKSY